MNNAFVSWSGGKDCCLACHQAMADGLNIRYLANMLTEGGTHSRSHGLSNEVLLLQSQAIGIPLRQGKATWDTYEGEFKKLLSSFKQEGVEDGVFGDIDLDEHREWVERVCSEVGIKAFLPLWGIKPEELIDEFLGLGFKAMIVATTLEKDLLEKVLDKALVNRITNIGSHPCGEGGEYHTFVTSGPIFKKALKVTQGRTARRDDAWFLEISAELK